MPLPLAASLALPVLQSGFNAIAANNANARSEAFTRNMYNLQKKDNIEFWNMQNAYNSDEQVVARMEKAGLNKAMMYGSGGGGQNPASPINTPDIKTMDYKTPDLSGLNNSGLAAFMDMEIKKAQADNLKADTATKVEDAKLRVAQTIASIAGTNMTKSQTDRLIFDLQQDSLLKDVSADYRKEQVRSLRTQSDVALSQNELNIAKNSSDIKEAAQRIISSRINNLMNISETGERIKTSQSNRAKNTQEIENLKESLEAIKKDNKIRDFEIQLNKAGMSKGDPQWSRALATYINQLMKNPPKREGGYLGFLNPFK